MTFFMSYPINRHRNLNDDRMRGSVPDVVKSTLICVQYRLIPCNHVKFEVCCRNAAVMTALLTFSRAAKSPERILVR